MSHSTIIIDKDPCFEIDAMTRAIKNMSSAKTTVMQFDHNSERFSFTMPRHVEGHDMMECTKVEVHYTNIDAATKERTDGVYEVADLAIDAEDDEKITCSWLLSQQATGRAGNLSFLLRFSCVQEDGTIDYAWNTAVFSGISVTAGMNNGDAVLEDYVDVLEQWKKESLGANIDANEASIRDIISGNNTLLNGCTCDKPGSYVKYKVERIMGENGTLGAAELTVCANAEAFGGHQSQVLKSYDLVNNGNAPREYGRVYDPNATNPDSVEVDTTKVQTVEEHHTSQWSGGSYSNSYYKYTAPEGFKIVGVMYDTGNYAVMLYEEMNSNQMPISVSRNTWLDLEPCDRFWLWESDSELTGTNVFIKIAPIVKGAWSEWVLFGSGGGSESDVEVKTETIEVPASDAATYTTVWDMEKLESIKITTTGKAMIYMGPESNNTALDWSGVTEAELVENGKAAIIDGGYNWISDGEAAIVTIYSMTGSPITATIEETRKK